MASWRFSSRCRRLFMRPMLRPGKRYRLRKKSQRGQVVILLAFLKTIALDQHFRDQAFGPSSKTWPGSFFLGAFAAKTILRKIKTMRKGKRKGPRIHNSKTAHSHVLRGLFGGAIVLGFFEEPQRAGQCDPHGSLNGVSRLVILRTKGSRCTAHCSWDGVQ